MIDYSGHVEFDRKMTELLQLATVRMHTDMKTSFQMDWISAIRDSSPFRVLKNPKEPKFRDYFWGSDKIMGCPRQLVFKMMGNKPDQEHTPNTLRKFMIGHAVEAEITSALMFLDNYTLQYPNYDGDELRMHWNLDEIDSYQSCALDAVLTHNETRHKIPVEIKKMHEGALKYSIKSGTVSNKFGYVDQIQTYIHLLDAPYGYIIGVDAQMGNVGVWKVLPHGDFRNNVVKHGRVIMQYLQEGTIPSIPSWATGKIVNVRGMGYLLELVNEDKNVEKTCTYCDFKSKCFPGAFKYGDRWFKELTPEEVEAEKQRRREKRNKKEKGA